MFVFICFCVPYVSSLYRNKLNKTGEGDIGDEILRIIRQNRMVEAMDVANPEQSMYENPIGPDTSSQASTQSVGSSDDFGPDPAEPAVDTDEITLPQMVREFDRLEE